MGNLKNNKLVNITTTTTKQTHKHRQQTSGYQWRTGRGRTYRGEGVRDTN